MSIAVVANARDAATGVPDQVVTTPDVDSTGATFLCGSIAYYEPAGTLAYTDSKGNTATATTAHTTAVSKNGFYYVANPTVGSSHTTTITSSNNNFYGEWDVAFFSGVLTTSPFDTENGATATTGSSLATGSITPVANALVVAGLGNNAGGSLSTATIDNSFTITDQNDDRLNQSLGGALAWKEVASGSINPTWSWTGTATTVAASIASFKPAASAAAVASTVLLMGV